MEENKVQETMADYSKELEASFRKIKEGDILSGTVISVDETGVILDLNYYAPGVIKAEDISNDPNFSILEDIKIGDVLEATVIKTDDRDGNICLSRKEASELAAWDVLKKYLEEETHISVKISEIVKAGAVAYAEGIRGFIPASHLSLAYVENLDEWLGRQLTVQVITVDKEQNKLVLSAKNIEREQAAEEKNHKIAMLVPGSVMEGTVESLMPYGAFVALPEGLSGLVHISQISMKRIKHPSEVLKTGDKVQVKILNTKDQKISLSMKALEEEMTSTVEEASSAFEYSSGEEVTTTLGDLFKNIKL